MKKKILLLCASLLFGANAFGADYTYVITDLNMDNFWQKTGKPQEKVSIVAKNLILKNQFNYRAPVFVIENKTPNATTNHITRIIEIHSGLLPLIDNDDELAFIIGHEMSHATDSYGGFMKILKTMGYNSKSYEYKCDMKSIDYMVKAGYDPISAIIIGNKFFNEPHWDWGQTHPKGSKRLIKMYKYIYKKYPQYLTSDKTNNPYYKNFEYIFAEELKGFHHKESVRQQKQLKKEAI